MNKSRHSIPAQLRKKMKKEVKTATLQPEPTLRSDRITPSDLLSRFPMKSKQKAGQLKQALKKDLNKMAKKPHASKRTTPGTVDDTSSPRHPHIEGNRWIKTGEKQTSAKRKIFTKHFNKK
jgi:hypothetical protein